MLDNRSDSSASAAANPSPAAPRTGENNESGFRGFNRVGREDSTTEVLRPQAPPDVRLRRAIMIAVVAALLIVVGCLAFSRSHLTFGGVEDSGHGFNAPTHD